MKKLFIYLFATTVLAATFVACEKNELTEFWNNNN